MGNDGSTLPPAVDDKKPAIKSSESPGRKKPISNPDSANTMAARSNSPPLSSHDSISNNASM